MSIFELWLFTTVIPELSGTLNVFAWISAIFVVASFFIIVLNDDEDDISKRGKKYGKWALVCLVVFGLSTSIVPNERQMLLIAGGSVATNNADMKQLPANAAKAANAWLDAVTKAAETVKK